jgi:hypothetical protein
LTLNAGRIHESEKLDVRKLLKKKSVSIIVRTERE